ncbi:MAG: VWA domain-containing protein [Pyrinomonadaceae bacterium]|nr:VWA domain-containing protein [Pyrinomonadaceae bacterium]
MGEKLNAKAASEKGVYAGKVIIIISDGEDRVSAVKKEQLIKELKESSIKVYAIGLTQELGGGGGGRNSKGRAETFLRNITAETGGRVIFPKRNATDIESLLNELLAE